MAKRLVVITLVVGAVAVCVCSCGRQQPEGADSSRRTQTAARQPSDPSALDGDTALTGDDAQQTSPEAHTHAGEQGHHDGATVELSGHLEEGVREVEVSAFMYGYKPDPIAVRRGETVRLVVKSTDVMHGLGIADLDVDVKVSPGQAETVEFAATQAGSFHMHCTQYCGPGHDDMHGELLVVE